MTTSLFMWWQTKFKAIQIQQSPQDRLFWGPCAQLCIIFRPKHIYGILHYQKIKLPKKSSWFSLLGFCFCKIGVLGAFFLLLFLFFCCFFFFKVHVCVWLHLTSTVTWWNHSLAAAANTWKARVVVLLSQCSLSFLCIPGVKMEREETHKSAVVAYVHLAVMEVWFCSRTNALGNFSIWSCQRLHDYQESFCLNEEIKAAACGDNEWKTMHFYHRLS